MHIFQRTKGLKEIWILKKSDLSYIYSGNYSKSNFISRRFGDLKYGNKVGELIVDFHPDIILSGNTPTEAQEIILKHSRK